MTYRHNHARQTNVRAQSLSHTSSLPERRDEVVLLVAVDYSGEDVVCVGGGAYCEEYAEQEVSEVEERGLAAWC